MYPIEYSVRKLGQLRIAALLKEAKEERLAKLALNEEERSGRASLHFLPRCFQRTNLSQQRQ